MFQGKDDFSDIYPFSACARASTHTHTQPFPLSLAYTLEKIFKHCKIQRIQFLLVKQLIPALTFLLFSCYLLAGKLAMVRNCVLRLMSMKNFLARFRTQGRVMESEDPCS